MSERPAPRARRPRKSPFDAGVALIEVALADSAAELAASRTRVARLEAAAVLERAGDRASARRLIAQVTREQARLARRAKADE